jgi:hypothetical protein
MKNSKKLETDHSSFFYTKANPRVQCGNQEELSGKVLSLFVQVIHGNHQYKKSRLCLWLCMWFHWGFRQAEDSFFLLNREKGLSDHYFVSNPVSIHGK